MGILDQEIPLEDKELNSNWKDTATSIGGCLTYLVFFLSGIIFIILLIRGVPWIAENIYPLVSLITVGLFLIITPISILLAFFKKTRGISGIGFILSSYAVGFGLWLWSLILTYALAGKVWLIIGLLFAGIGVVPIAIIASLTSGEWIISIQLLTNVVLVYGLRVLGNYLIEKDAGKISLESNEVSEEPIESYEKNYKINTIVDRYGKFIAEEKPLITDIAHLPYPKEEINWALLEKEQELCNMANNIVKTESKDGLPEIDKLLDAIRSVRVFLKSYVEIEEEDQVAVDYFNSFDNEDKIPDDEKDEFAILRGKYMTKWLQNEK